MKIKKDTQSNLVIESFDLFPGIITFPAALFVLYKIIESLLKQPVFDKDMVGAIVAFLGFYFATAIFSEYSIFDFNIYQQKLFWKRLSLLGKREGELLFESIKNVVLQTSQSSRASMLFRLAIISEDKTIPLTRYYTARAKDNCVSIRNAILDTLRRDASGIIEESIWEMLAAGNKIQAIKLARAHYKMSLKEAKELIENLPK